MGSTLICKKKQNFTRKFHEIPNFVFTKKFPWNLYTLMLNCIDFMKIEKKSSVQLQISMHLAQEPLSYFQLGYFESRAPNGTQVCFYKKFWL